MPFFGNRPIEFITPADGDQYILARQKRINDVNSGEGIKESAAAGTIRREWKVLMRILNLTVRRDLLHKNRLKAVELPDADRRTRVASASELKAIGVLRNRVMPEVLAELWRVVVAELNTGLRESKLLTVHRSWIREETDGWWLILPPSRSRLNDAPNRIPLNASALWALSDPPPHCLMAECFAGGMMCVPLRSTGRESAPWRRSRTCISMISDIPSRAAYKVLASIMKCARLCSDIACQA